MGFQKIDYAFYCEPKMFIEKNTPTSIKSKNKILSCYVFGFNGKEKNDETYGTGNELDFGARIYDSRLGRWFATDTLIIKNQYVSPYTFASHAFYFGRNTERRIHMFMVIPGFPIT